MSSPRTRDEIENEIALRYAQIDRLHQEIAHLKGSSNLLSPVSRLPNEVLSQVFYHLMRSYDSRDIWRGRLHEYIRGEPHQWLVICQICRRWREVAVSFPRLWSRIVFTQTEGRWEEFLARSKAAPLSFEPRQSEYLTYDQAKFVFQYHIHRTLHLEGLRLGHGFSKRLARVEIPKTLPLQTLDIEATSERLEAFAPLSLAEMPNLRALRCAGMTAAFARSLLRPTITELAVEHLSNLPSGREWVDLLLNMPLLTKLKLHAAVSPLDPTAPPYGSQHKVCLNQLQAIHLSDLRAGHACAALLEQLLYPPSAEVVFRSTMFALDQNPIPVLALLGRKLVEENRAGPRRQLKAIYLDDLSARGLTLTASASDDNTLHISFPYEPNARDFWLRHAVEHIQTNTATQLGVNAFRDINARSWLEISPRLTSITYLALGAEPNLTAFVTALEEGGTTFLPNLSELVFSRCYMAPHLQRLSAALRARKTHGLNLLHIEDWTLTNQLRSLKDVAKDVVYNAV